MEYMQSYSIYVSIEQPTLLLAGSRDKGELIQAGCAMISGCPSHAYY